MSRRGARRRRGNQNWTFWARHAVYQHGCWPRQSRRYRDLAHARRAGGTARSTARSRRGGGAVDTAKVREWAKGQGIEVKDRGRVPAGVVEQYQTAAGA
jgi:hypothetical protein